MSPRIVALVLSLCVLPAVAKADAEYDALSRFYELQKTNPAAALIHVQRAADRQTKSLKLQLEAAYALLRQKDRVAEIFLERAAQLAPKRADIWKQLGYARLSRGDKSSARDAFRTALLLSPNDQELRLEIVYLEDALGMKRSAALEARHVALSGSVRALQACRLHQTNAGLPDRALPGSWFAETYAAPEYRRRDKVAVATGHMRIGYSLLDQERLETYASLRGTWDTRSHGGGTFGPEIFFDGSVVVSGGLRSKPVDQLPVTVFVETGAAADLIDRNRETWRSDTRVGAVMSWGWMGEGECTDRPRVSLRPVIDAYADFVWYSRYDNAIGFARIRPGVRLLESGTFLIDGYALVAGTTDTAGHAGNRTHDLGLGLAVTVLSPLRTTLRYEIVQAHSQARATAIDHRWRIEHQARF